jgi:hypothetical protein
VNLTLSKMVDYSRGPSACLLILSFYKVSSSRGQTPRAETDAQEVSAYRVGLSLNIVSPFTMQMVAVAIAKAT